MAEYYGTIQGHRGIASRCGSGKSGMRAMVKSWTNTINVWLYNENGQDVVKIEIPKGVKTIINGKEFVVD